MVRKYLIEYQLVFNLPVESLLFKVFQAPGNKEIFLDDYPERKNL